MWRSFKNELKKEAIRVNRDLWLAGLTGVEPITAFPFTGTQIDNVICEALSMARMNAKATWDKWRQLEFATDVAAFNIWKTINARKIVGEFCTILRRQLQDFRLKAVAYRSQTGINYRESLYHFLEALTNPTTWHNAISGKKTISSTYMSKYAIFCIHSEKWTPANILTHVDKEVDFLRDYLISNQTSLASAQRFAHLSQLNPPRTIPMTIPSNKANSDDVFMGYIDAELMSADNTTTRMENIIKEARKTNEEATVVAERLVTIRQGNLPTT